MPPRLVFVNGFLGAGKTSAIHALAKLIGERGLRAGIITNDQSRGLVDSLVARNRGLTAAEVAGGCFCCKFDDLVFAIDQVLAHEPDFVLCEAVGSCTDMVATVIEPFRRFYSNVADIAPFTVVVDAQTVQARLEADDDLAYIFHKQIEEADIVLLNKSDVARADVRFADKRVIETSALRGDGIAAWFDALTSAATSHPLVEIDYDRYAHGESMLAWLNGHARVECDAPTLLASLRSSLTRSHIDVAHLKFTLRGKRVQMTALDSRPSIDDEVTGDELILNIRARSKPEALCIAVSDALRWASPRSESSELQAFAPAYPHPQFRIDSSGVLTTRQ